MKEYYRDLPHIQPVEAVFFVTARLHGSIPITILHQLREEREQELTRATLAGRVGNLDKSNQRKRDFARYESHVDNPQNEPYWLGKPDVAQLVVDTFLFRHNTYYELIAYCVMSNHYHLVIDTRQFGNQERPLHRIMQVMHSYIATKCNQVLSRSGTFRHDEYYDHIIRDDAELQRVIEYTLQNPVKAGLVDEWEKWPYSYVNEAYW